MQWLLCAAPCGDAVPTMNPVQFLAHKFPGKTEREYRQHLGNFQITGMTGLQPIGTQSEGHKSRVAFAVLSRCNAHTSYFWTKYVDPYTHVERRCYYHLPTSVISRQSQERSVTPAISRQFRRILSV